MSGTPRPQLVARLAGMIAIGICLRWPIASAVDMLIQAGYGLTADGSSVGMILGSILLLLDAIGWDGLWEYVASCWMDLLGLAAGCYLLFGGVRPIAWMIKRERRVG